MVVSSMACFNKLNIHCNTNSEDFKYIPVNNSDNIQKYIVHNDNCLPRPSKKQKDLLSYCCNQSKI